MTVVAIDGPAGAGKSTVARALARALGWTYLDTGAMYRAVAWAALQRDLDPCDEPSLEVLARGLEIDATSESVLVNGADVSARIRAPDVSAVVSRVAAHPRVRAVLTDRQRDIARRRDVVMEGRDIGATVAPDAALKVYLTADLSTRAARRAAQLGRADDRDTLRELTRSLAERDAADSSRAASPLIAPPDAVILDTTDMSVDDVVATVMEELRFRTGD